MIDILLVEFNKHKGWKKLVSFANRQYSCNLCSVVKISNFSCLNDHLKGKKHANNVTLVHEFYHPTLTGDKSGKDLKFY